MICSSRNSSERKNNESLYKMAGAAVLSFLLFFSILIFFKGQKRLLLFNHKKNGKFIYLFALIKLSVRVSQNFFVSFFFFHIPEENLFYFIRITFTHFKYSSFYSNTDHKCTFVRNKSFKSQKSNLKNWTKNF